MEYQIIVLALALFVLLSLIGFLLFKRKAKVGFTIAKWFKFDFEGSNESDSARQEPIVNLEKNEPTLILKLIDSNGQYKDELTFVQTTNNQDFLFGIALINIAEGSIPAEKLDIQIEISWDGTDISKAPKFRATDTYGRAIPGWTAPRQQIQQSDIPLPARLSFHGTNDMRCPFGHPLEWYRFSVLLAEKSAGRFILNYTVSSASPVIENKGKCYIKISPTQRAADGG